MNQSNSRHFDALTGFRCLAACLVFLYHNKKYWRDQLHPEISRLLNELHIGVSLFFVLSGFLIAYTYAEAPLHSAKKYAEYFSIRLVRIMPLYWLILTAYYLDPAFGEMKFTWLTYSLFHGFSDLHNLDAISQSWSLNIEMTFYLLAPLLCLLQKKHLIYLLFFLALLLLGTWGIGAYWHRVNGNPGRWLYPVHFIFTGTFAGRCPEFVAGMLLAFQMRNNSTQFIEKFRFKTLIGFAGILSVVYCIRLFQPNALAQGDEAAGGLTLQNIVLPVFVVIALAGLIYEKTWLQKFFASKTMVLLGNASFAFYLVHISYVSIKLREWVLLPDRNFVLLWFISIALYLLFEKPVYNGYRKWLKRRDNTPVPVSN